MTATTVGLHRALRDCFFQGREHADGTAVKWGSGSSTKEIGRRVDTELAHFAHAPATPEALKACHKYTRKLVRWLQNEKITLCSAQDEVRHGRIRSAVDLFGRRVDTGALVLIEIKTGYTRGGKYSGNKRMSAPFDSVPDTPFNRCLLQAHVYAAMIAADEQLRVDYPVDEVVVLIVNDRKGVAHAFLDEPKWFRKNKENAMKVLLNY